MWALFESILGESCEQCRWWRNISVHGLSDSVIKNNNNSAFPFHSFTENGEWVCALVGGIPTFCTRRRDALCWRDEFSELCWQGARPDGGKKYHTDMLLLLLPSSSLVKLLLMRARIGDTYGAIDRILFRNTEVRIRAATPLFSKVWGQ